MDPWTALTGFFRLDKQKVRKMHLQNTDLPQTVVLWIAGQLVSQNTSIFQCLFMIKCLWFKMTSLNQNILCVYRRKVRGHSDWKNSWIKSFMTSSI